MGWRGPAVLSGGLERRIQRKDPAMGSSEGGEPGARGQRESLEGDSVVCSEAELAWEDWGRGSPGRGTSPDKAPRWDWTRHAQQQESRVVRAGGGRRPRWAGIPTRRDCGRP